MDAPGSRAANRTVLVETKVAFDSTSRRSRAITYEWTRRSPARAADSDLVMFSDTVASSRDRGLTAKPGGEGDGASSTGAIRANCPPPGASESALWPE